MKSLLVLSLLGVSTPLMLAQTATDGQTFTWMTGSVVSVLAGCVIAFLRGWVVGGGTHERVVKERDQAYEELRARNKEDRELLIPAMIRNTEVMARIIEPKDGGR
jgi:hypothetical protein